ncbi:MAG: isoprenoid biosynthesis glyoxalase ElbB [Bacteroidales bacterium]|jgi:enhancing lycopene biosynthesis protein 2|nr:isoprenoid biosynthesis glyoxalase ElbB [Bacteroidales bacterium]
MKRFAVILCGCGASDGSEIHEAVMTLLAIDRHKCHYSVFAPDENQYHVMNMFTKEEMPETRNMLVEAARIARGNVLSLSELDISQFDALILPGGFGAAKNLCTYAFDGANATVYPPIAKIVKAAHQKQLPIGALCIAPVILAKVLGKITITVGNDPDTIANVEQMGATHVNTQEGEVIADKANRIFTTPCYMLPATVADIADSADNLIRTILENL